MSESEKYRDRLDEAMRALANGDWAHDGGSNTNIKTMCVFAAGMLEAADAQVALKFPGPTKLTATEAVEMARKVQEDTDERLAAERVEEARTLGDPKPPAPSAQARKDANALQRFAAELRGSAEHYYYIPRKLDAIAARIERGYAGGGE